MPTNAGQLVTNLSLNFKQFTRGIKQAQAQVRDLGTAFRNAFNQANRSIQGTNSALTQASRQMKDFERIVGGIIMSQAFYRLTNEIQDAIGSVIEFTNNMDKAQISLEYFLGSAERAAGFIANMKDFAAETAFSTDQALTLSRRLMAAQFDPTQVRAIMEVLNDASAATGGTADQMDRIVLALTQMKTNGKIAGQEMRQLAEAGIPVYKILQEQLGLTGEQLMNIGDLKISGDIGVQAVLQGLAERYQGAAERMANETIPGLWEAIKDNMLFISSELIQVPQKAFKTWLKGWRDAIENARVVMQERGLGGLMEAVFPEELHLAIRLITGSVMSMAKSFSILHQALVPVYQVLGGSVVQALGGILPTMATVLRVLANLTKAALEAVPILKYFAAAILGLVVARTAAKALMFLWSVMRLGAVAAVVAQAVALLTNAIKALFLVLTRNPIVGAIMVIAGALLYLALSSKTVTEWLDRLMARLGALGGFQVGEILQPEETGIDKWVDEFNEAINLIGDELTEVGEDGKKAAKEIEKSFLASFDEVFKVPEEKDPFDELGLPEMPALSPMGMGPIPKLPEMPKIPQEDIEIPKITWIDPPPWVGKIHETQFRIKFDPPDGGTAYATVWETTMDRIRAAMRQTQLGLATALEAIANWLPQLNPVPHLAPIPEAVAQWLQDLARVFQGFPALNWGWEVYWETFPLTPLGALQYVRDIVANGVSSLGTAIGETMAGVLAGWKENWALFPSDPISALAGVLAGTQPMLQYLVDNINNTLTAIQDMWSIGWEVFKAVAGSAGAAITALIGGDTAKWQQFFNDFVAGAETVWSTAWQVLTALASGNMSAIGNILKTGMATVVAQMGIDLDTIKQNWELLQAALSMTASMLVQYVTTEFTTWMTNLKQTVTDGLENLKRFWENHGNTVMSIVGIALTAILGLFTGGFGSILSGATAWLPRLLGVFKRIEPGVRALIAGFPKWFDDVLREIPGNVGKWVSQIVAKFKELPGKIMDAIKSIPDKVKSVFGSIELPSFSAAGDGVKATFSRLASVAGFKDGGIIGRDSIVRVGEQGKREAIVPLQNETAMKPFSDAVAAEVARSLGSMLQQYGRGGSSGDGGDAPEQQQILYVGTLIADDRSLRELERRMKVIRVSEERRGAK